MSTLSSKISQSSLTASIRKAKNNYTDLQEETYKKQLFQFEFFKNHLSLDTSPKNVFFSLSKFVKIAQLNINETIAIMNNHTTTVFFIIKGEIGGYNKLSEQLLEHMIPVKIYGEGQVIGYLGDRNQFTLKTMTSCIIGQIAKVLMNSILIKQVQYETKNDVTFFFSHPFFYNWKKTKIETMLFNINKRELKKGEQLTIQGNLMRKIYIVRKGNVKVSFSKTRSHHSEYDIEFYQMLSDPNDRFSTQRKFELVSSYNESELFQLFIVTNGDVIGDFEIKNKKQAYYFTSICEVDNTIIYEIDVDSFKALMPEKYIEYLKQMLIPKETLFRERFNSIMNNTKRPMSKYARKILDKIPPPKAEVAKLCYSQAHFKVKIIDVKNIALKGVGNNSLNNNNNNIKTSKRKASQSITNDCNNSDYKSRNQPVMFTIGTNIKSSITAMKTFDSANSMAKKRNKKMKMFQTDIPKNRIRRFRDMSGDHTIFPNNDNNQNEIEQEKKILLHEGNDSNNLKAIFSKCHVMKKGFFIKHNPSSMSSIKEKVNSIFKRGYS